MIQEIEKPYYTIYPSIYCSGVIYVNDVPAFTWFGKENTEGDGGYGGAIPINNLVLESGKYQVRGKMFPRYGNKSLTEEEYMSIEFYKASAVPEKWKSSRVEYIPKLESPWNGLSDGINHPYFEIATEIEVTLPFVLDGWQKSVELTTIDKKILFKEVLKYYQQIHAVLKTHNAAKFLELSKEKMQLQEQAFYFTNERKKDFREGALKLFNQKLELLPLVASELTLEIIGHGKLVRLMRTDGTEPLQFKSPKPLEQSNIELEVKLHKRSEEKGFSII